MYYAFFIGGTRVKKRVLKTIVIILLLCFITIPLLIKVINRNTRLKWPEGNMAALIPRPNSRYGRIEINGEKELLLDIYRVNKADFDEYILSSNNRFKWFEKHSDIFYSAYDSEGNVLEIDYYSADNMMRVHVYESKEAQILKGIEHYELEYHAYSKPYELPNIREYDEVLSKYTIPVKTTIRKLNEDFPFNKTTEVVNKSIHTQEIELDNDELVWVFATYMDQCAGKYLKFTYDKLNVSSDHLEIKTHFDILKTVGTSAENYRVIIISIIPVEQLDYLNREGK